MNPRPLHMKNPSGFTLTELLAVIVILAIVMAAAVPAFMSMGGSGKVEAAAAQLSATLRQARQFAIANNQEVSVVFPHATTGVHINSDYPTLVQAATASEGDLYSNFISKKRMLRGYAVYTPRDKYVTDWKFLPDGVIFNCVTNGTTNLLYDNNAIMDNISYPEDASAGLQMQAVTYRPDGTTPFGAIPLRIFLADGFTNAEEDPAAEDMAYTLTGPPVQLYLEIAPLTGMVKVIRN